MRALVLLTFALLAACGQSGDLYLPPPKETPATAPPIETPSPAEGTQEQKEDRKGKQ